MGSNQVEMCPFIRKKKVVDIIKNLSEIFKLKFFKLTKTKRERI